MPEAPVQQAEYRAAPFNNDSRGRGTLGASMATPVLRVDTVSHNSLKMTISSSVTVDISRQVLAIITTVTAKAAVDTISLVCRISAMILAITGLLPEQCAAKI